MFSFLPSQAQFLLPTEVSQATQKNEVHAAKKSIHLNISKQNIKKEVLANGMTVLVYQNPSIPKVLVQVAYNVGSSTENAGERGLAHLIEHMIFKGTSKLSETDIDAIARKYGATYNAFTSMDVTSYFFETNKNNWKPFMEILADCMQNARFDEQHLASELRAVIQELKMYKDNYWSMMFLKINALEHPANHPYHYPTIGYKEDLMSISAHNLKHFYEKYYHPDRATLFVVGDVDPDEVIKQSRHHFEKIPARKTHEYAFFPELAPDLVVHDTCLYEDIKSEQLGFYWRIPGLRDADELLSTAAAFLLSGGEGSRLYRLLVDEQKVASSVMVIPQKFMESGIFLILIEPHAGKREACKTLVEQALLQAVEQGFSEHEMTHMVCSEGKKFFHKLENFSALTYEWLMSYFATSNEYALFDKVAQIERIQSSQIQAFMKTYLDPVCMNQMSVLPLPESKKELYQMVKQQSDALDQKILAKYERITPIESPRFALTMPQPEPLHFVFPKPDREIVLPNGLKVLLHVNHALPLISLQSKFKEAASITLALDCFSIGLMMNMLMEESKGYTKKDNVDFFEYYGAQYDFNAGGCTLSLLNADYKKLFERFVHVMSNPTFPAHALEKLKAIQINALERCKDDPTSVGMQQLKTMIYKNHPFGWTFDQAIEVVKNLSVADLVSLHRLLVNPTNMIVSVVGDFELNEMEALIKSLFGNWQPGVVFTMNCSTGSFVENEQVQVPMLRDQVVLLLGQPSPLNIYHPDIVPLKLLNNIAFYFLGSRIYNLRQQSGLFYTAFGSWATAATKEIGFDYVGTILNPENADSVQAQMRTLLNELAQNGVTQQELESAQLLYLKTLIDSVSNNRSVAHLMTTLASFDLGFDYYDKVLQRVQAMDVKELNAIAAQYFNADKLSVVKVGRVA